MELVSTLSTPISLENVPPLLPGRNYSSITFDDGFEDFIFNALPVLLAKQIPSTVFVTSGVFGKKAMWWPEGAPERLEKIASAEKWLEVHNVLTSIGSHTLTHPHLLSLTEEEARHELSESRMILEELLKRNIKTFSFPYGEFSADLIKWCHEAGYEHVFTTLPYNAFRNTGEYVSGRMSVDPRDWILEFRLKLLGAYRWLPYAMCWKDKILSIFRLCRSLV